MEADEAQGYGDDGWTKEKPEELRRLRRNPRLKQEVCSERPAAWFARETESGGSD